MIKVRARAHDKYSIEFKVWFQDLKSSKHLKINENVYKIDSWLFVPGSLDINSLTYSREQFYSDLKTYYRTITPSYSLESLCKQIKEPNKYKKNSPYLNLSNAINNLLQEVNSVNVTEYEYKIKMYSAIFQSAIRDELSELNNAITKKLSKQDNDAFVDVFTKTVYIILY